MNALVSIVALVAACLAAVVVFELRPSASEAPDPVPRASSATAAGPRDAPAATPPMQGARVAALREALLTRPLFSQTRRPPNVAGPAAAAARVAEPLPRMTAILIDGPNRRAIFAGPQGGKPTIVVEGGHLGAFTIQAIEPRQVTVIGPDGQRTVRTAFDPTLPAAAAMPVAGFAQPQFPGIQLPGMQLPGMQLPGSAPGGRMPGSPILSPGVTSSPFPSQLPTPGPDAGNGLSPGAAR